MDWSEIVFEMGQLFMDFLKHVTTLSTGSIILMTAFLEQLFSKPKWKALTIIAYLGLVVAILSSVVAIGSGIVLFPRMAEAVVDSTADQISTEVGLWTNLWLFPASIALLSFAVGVTSLGIFAVRNLLAS